MFFFLNLWIKTVWGIFTQKGMVQSGWVDSDFVANLIFGGTLGTFPYDIHVQVSSVKFIPSGEGITIIGVNRY